MYEASTYNLPFDQSCQNNAYILWWFWKWPIIWEHTHTHTHTHTYPRFLWCISAFSGPGSAPRWWLGWACHLIPWPWPMCIIICSRYWSVAAWRSWRWTPIIQWFSWSSWWHLPEISTTIWMQSNLTIIFTLKWRVAISYHRNLLNTGGL